MGKTIVTGAGGMVGYAFRQLNPPDTVFLTRDDVDLTDFNATKTAFKLLKPEKVIHLAGVVAGVGGNIIHSGEFFRKNILINTNVLESARLCGAQKLISYMSTCVFPDPCTYPLNEKDIHNGPPHPSNFAYAYAKRMLEVQSSAYRQQWNCHYIVAIPANIYGPNDIWNLEEGHVIPSLIHKCYLAEQNGTALAVWGSGKPLREFVFSYDIARLSLWAIDSYQEDSPIIFSSGIEISIKDLVELVVEKMKFTGKVVLEKSKPDGQYRKPSDTSKLAKYLPDFTFTPIEEGIEITIDWFLSNYPNIRM